MKTELNPLMACCILFSACGSLKTTKTLQTQNLQSNNHYQEHSNKQSWAKGNTLMLDTSNSEYVVQITPLGKFRYSAENGFEGMAEKVLISGKASKRQILHQQQHMGEQLQHQKRSQESTQLKTKALHTEKERKGQSSILWIGLLLVPSLGLAYWLRGKRLWS